MKRKLFSFAVPVLFAAIVVSCQKEKPVTSENNEVTTTKEGDKYVIDTLNSKVEWKGYKVFKSENTGHFGTITFESRRRNCKRWETGKWKICCRYEFSYFSRFKR